MRRMEGVAHGLLVLLASLLTALSLQGCAVHTYNLEKLRSNATEGDQNLTVPAVGRGPALEFQHRQTWAQTTANASVSTDPRQSQSPCGTPEFKRSRGKCTVDYDIDFQTPADGTRNVGKSPEHCCDQCRAQAECMVAIYYDGICYFKTSASETYKVSKPGSVAIYPNNRLTAKEICDAGRCLSFPAPREVVRVPSTTQEQAWLAQEWPGYLNGVNLGGIFVVEDWMFWRSEPPFDPATLHLRKGPFDQHAWSLALLQMGKKKAFETFECHTNRFVSDEDLDALAEFGINAARIPVGYWLFDDEQLYPHDPWAENMSGSPPYGVNPEGFITPGTLPLSDLVVKLHNRDIKVIIEMHASPGCSSAHQSNAGIICESDPPNLWAGKAQDGVSGGHSTLRMDDDKTWADVFRKIMLERVVPWIRFMERLVPGTIIALATVNEPNSPPRPDYAASQEMLRALTLDLGKDLADCLGDLSSKVKIGISTGVQNGNNYPASDLAEDYKSNTYSNLRGSYLTDLHHFFAWRGCAQGDSFSVQCVCESNLPGSDVDADDQVWSDLMRAGVLRSGWGFFVGAWSVGMRTHLCHGNVPSAAEAKAMWKAQKWGFLSQYLAYKDKGPTGSMSSFMGDFYWNVRLGKNWNPEPQVCAGAESASGYEADDVWDWSLLRLIKLQLAEPLSKLTFTQANLALLKEAICIGTFPMQCETMGPMPPTEPAQQVLNSSASPRQHLPEEWWHETRPALVPNSLATPAANATVQAAGFVQESSESPRLPHYSPTGLTSLTSSKGLATVFAAPLALSSALLALVVALNRIQRSARSRSENSTSSRHLWEGQDPNSTSSRHLLEGDNFTSSRHLLEGHAAMEGLMHWKKEELLDLDEGAL